MSPKTPEKSNGKEDGYLLNFGNISPSGPIEENGIMVLAPSCKKPETKEMSLADAFASKKSQTTCKKPPRPELQTPKSVVKSTERPQKSREELLQIRKEMMRNRSNSKKELHSVSFSQSEQKLNVSATEEIVNTGELGMKNHSIAVSERRVSVRSQKDSSRGPKAGPGITGGTPKIMLDLTPTPTPSQKKKCREPSQELLERLAKGEKPVISRKEMFELTRKNYAKLPEVLAKQRRASESNKTDLMERASKKKALDQRLREGNAKKKS
jgi:hypothetical protein